MLFFAEYHRIRTPSDLFIGWRNVHSTISCHIRWKDDQVRHGRDDDSDLTSTYLVQLCQTKPSSLLSIRSQTNCHRCLLILSDEVSLCS